MGECSEMVAPYDVHPSTIGTWLDAMGYDNPRFRGGDDVAAVEGAAVGAGRAGREAQRAAGIALLDPQLTLRRTVPEEAGVAADHRPHDTGAHQRSLGMNLRTRNSMLATTSSPTYQVLREVTK